jgi:hypothetical protein
MLRIDLGAQDGGHRSVVLSCGCPCWDRSSLPRSLGRPPPRQGRAEGIRQGALVDLALRKQERSLRAQRSPETQGDLHPGGGLGGIQWGGPSAFRTERSLGVRVDAHSGGGTAGFGPLGPATATPARVQGCGASRPCQPPHGMQASRTRCRHAVPVALRPRLGCRDPLPPALQAQHGLRRLAASGAIEMPLPAIPSAQCQAALSAHRRRRARQTPARHRR